MEPVEINARVRIDKWLWAARFYKTRSLATKAVEAGQVRLNGERTKPAHDVKLDDVLSIQIGQSLWEIRVRAISDVRRSAGIAQTLYAETERSMERREALAAHRKLYKEPANQIKGRPTKRDRRQLDRISQS